MPSSLLKAQGMRLRLRVYGLSRVEQSQGEKGYARQEETVLFSLRTGAEPVVLREALKSPCSRSVSAL